MCKSTRTRVEKLCNNPLRCITPVTVGIRYPLLVLVIVGSCDMAETSNASNIRDHILELETRLRRIEGFVGAPEEPSDALFAQIDGLNRSNQTMKISVADLSEFVERRIVFSTEDVESRLDAFDVDLNLLKKAIMTGSVGSSSSASKFKVPEPKSFSGARSAKELENFLWDMETYFSASKVPEEEKSP